MRKKYHISGFLLIIFLSGCSKTFYKISIPEKIFTNSSHIIENPSSSVIPATTTVIEKPVAIEKPKEVVPSVIENPAGKFIETDLVIVGEEEPVLIDDMPFFLMARIDTGAQTSSVGATDIKRFERDGKTWVRFRLHGVEDENIAEIAKPLLRIAKIKVHGQPDPQKRLVIKLKVKLGDIVQKREFTLVDRSEFEFPVLIGRNVLDGHFLVDVSKKNLTSPMKEKPHE